MEFKHTPGPWRIDPAFCSDIQTEDGKYEIASTSPYVLDGGNAPEEWEANARLIAAAPELLECLMWYVKEDDCAEGMEGNEFWEDGLNRARAAIAKAIGKTA